MGNNRQQTGDTSTDTQTDAEAGTDFTGQQQQQPAPTGSLEEPTGDSAVNNPNIINR